MWSGVITILVVIEVCLCLDTWHIPYKRNAVPMPGSQVTAPLSSCSSNFNTKDGSECFTIEHDQAAGVVNVTAHCCIWNELMFKKESMISANAYRCEVLVCEEKRSGVGVEIVSKHPVFTEGKQMSGCCLKDGIMYKPGASFYDAATDTTLVCCSGSIYASLPDSSPPPPPAQEPTTEADLISTTEKSALACPSYSCGPEEGFQCKVGRRVDKFKLKKTDYALFPSLIHQEGFSMHMYGGRESLQRDCHGHYFFTSNVKLVDDREDLSVKFLGLQRSHHLQGFMLKFSTGFSQAWAKMIDVEGGINPLVKDVALDSTGYIYALITYEQEDGAKMMRIQRYDQCGEFVSGFDTQAGTFISREAFISIDSQDDVIAFHSYSVADTEESSVSNPCHIVKVAGNMERILWDNVINIIDGETSCMPTGIKTDCEDNMYVTGFMASNKGFVRKYDKDGSIMWTKADFKDQITEVIYDPREDLLIITMSTESMVMLSSHGEVIKSIDIKAREIALGDDGYFAFHFMDGDHRIGYLNKELELVKNYDILWQDWNSISWCDNLVPNVYGTEVYLTCSLHDAQDVIIFQTKLGEEKTFLGARAVTGGNGL